MDMVDGIMGIGAEVVMDVAMCAHRFDDGADGVRVRVGCYHRGGEQRRENYSDDGCKPRQPALM
ncbi:MAG: hypothetical protein ACK4G5_08625, partial [Devosia sp.]